MIREQRSKQNLEQRSDPMYLEVVDESYRHNVPAGSGKSF